jgi:histidyl-tRNA synthetase
MPRKKIIKTKSGIKTKEKKTVSLQTPKGMRDILPEDWLYWEFIIERGKRLCQAYGYQRIETPALEETVLFNRGVGEATDIVEKEMYSLTTKGKEALSLRPEATAGIARAYIENGMANWPQPVKLFYIGPMFRYEKPQAGRHREFWQVGYEIIGDGSPALDAQVIQLAFKIFEKLGLKNLTIQVNSIGCSNCRPAYQKILKDYYRSKKNRICFNCQNRLLRNPLRLLDCKEERCIQVINEAPQSVDHLCPECHNHFKEVLEYLDELELPYILNPFLVRGLDYYTKTVFEIWPETGPFAGLTLGGGGRYDELIKTLGGEKKPAIGYSLGIERTVQEMKSQNIVVPALPSPKVFLVQLGDLARRKSLKLFHDLTEANIKTGESFGRGSIKSQLKVADRLGVKIALILGQKEAIDETIIIRNMETGMQEIVPLDKIVNEVKKRLKKI